MALSVRVARGTCAHGRLCALVLVPGVGVGPAGARHSWSLAAGLRKLPLALLRFLLLQATLEKSFSVTACLTAQCSTGYSQLQPNSGPTWAPDEEVDERLRARVKA